MDLVFEDNLLALIETDQAAQTRLPVAVIQSARRKLNAIRAAADERTLRNWKSLHYENLEANRAVRLNDQWRLVFRLDERCSPQRVTVIAVEDYH